MRSFPWDSLVTSIGDDGFPIYDRAYAAEDLREVYETFFSQGVFMSPGDDILQVTAGDGMSVVVAPGKCHIKGTIGYETSTRKLALQAAGSQDRISTVVLRWSNNIEDRNIDIYVVEGVESSTPVRPTLTRTETVFELGLCDIYIPKNTSAISAERITDTRLETERCGVVFPFDTIDTTTFYNQIQAAIDAKIADIDALQGISMFEGGFYAMVVKGEPEHLWVYYDSEEEPPPLSMNGGRLYYSIGDEAKLDLGRVNAMPAGSVMQYAGTALPDGWLFCDGATVSREEYPELFAAIGTTYGSGDGSTTFALPDLKPYLVLNYIISVGR